MDAATFRTDYPEFADTSAYPDSRVNAWLATAVALLDVCRWGDLYSQGQELFIAHYLALGKRAQLQAMVGGAPGAIEGPVTSKTVDKVSYSMDPKLVTLEGGAGHWNMTLYGVQFLQLMRLVGMGGMQL